MDIFTTALVKIRTNPIKADKLRVKALRKEAATSELTDDINHLEDHQLFFVDEKTHQQQKNKRENEKSPLKPENTDDEMLTQGIEPSDDVIIHKQDILHPHPAHDDDEDQDVKHLDIYI